MAYTQDGRRLVIKTPLGKDDLLLDGFTGQEAISRPFSFQLKCIAENTKKIPFDALLGQSITVEIALPDKSKKYINGICRRVAQGTRDVVFTRYVLEIVPRLWLLSKKTQSRIFQHLSVPDILKKVLADLDVKYEPQGVFQPRDFCVQYRESDFAFASRLMEEEGIYYFFKHNDGAHQMVVANTPGSHSDLPVKSTLIFDAVGGGTREEDRVNAWEKAQELCSGKVTLWDHCFELPYKHLEAESLIQGSISAGKSSHKLKVANNEKLELYDYPGAYAQRFDGINKGGGEQAAELGKIFHDNIRTAEIRMQEQAAASVLVHGAGNVRHLVSGHKFTLERHFEGDGPWVLYEVEHAASEAADVRSDHGRFTYESRFSCFPAALPFRPPRVTPRPTIAGTQTAVVVGPPGEEIFCDKYGRVKVQFHWDREGKKDPDSSCWIRVAQPWAGKRWGAFFWPRIGNEVVVSFEDGDPDKPLIVGSVYNFDNMPPFVLPLKNKYAGIKSASVRGLASENYNAIVFIDEKGHEHLNFHSERNMTFNAEFDKMFHGGRHKGERVSSTSLLTVGNLPGGGGSGGGSGIGDFVGSAPPSDAPGAVGVAGLNSTVVYGENLQVAVGINHQLSLGSNLQICVNPWGLFANYEGATDLEVSPAMQGLLGSGIGGNMQLTIGTNAQFVFGQSFDINLGPAKFTVDGGKPGHPVSNGICTVITALTIGFAIAYGITPSESGRALTIEVYQIAMSVALACLMLAEEGYKRFLNLTDESWQDAFNAAGWEVHEDADYGKLTRMIVEGVIIVLACTTPIIVKAIADK